MSSITRNTSFTTMVGRLFSLALLASSMLGTLAHNIQMGAHSRECFHEQLHKDDKMTVTFQVGDREFGGAGNLEVDFWVSASLLLCKHGAVGQHAEPAGKLSWLAAAVAASSSTHHSPFFNAAHRFLAPGQSHA
ncbi:MAG: emp24/gp25L/p24 family protein [Janthinobacterium lividum]